MSTDPNTQLPGVPQRSDGAPHGTPAAAPRPADGFLSSLSDLESRIGAFKAMHEQASAREMELAQRERALAEREAMIAANLEAASRTRADVDRRAAELVRKEEAVHCAGLALEARTATAEKSIAERTAILDRSEADLAEREKAMSAKLVRSEAEVNRVAAQEEELTAARRELDMAIEEVARREAEVADRAGSIVRDRETVEKLRAEVEAAERVGHDGLRKREEDIREGEADLAIHRAELERERAGVAEQARALAAQMKAQDEDQNAAIWSTRMESMQMEIGEAKAARARLETELTQSRAEIELLTSELINTNQNRGVSPEELAKRDQALEEARARLEESRAATRMLQDRIDVLEQTAMSESSGRARDIEEREDQLRVQRERIAANSRQLDAANAALERADADRGSMVSRSEYQRVEIELAAAKELLEQAETSPHNAVSAEELRKRDADIAGLEAALQEAQRSASELVRQEIETREATIAELREQIARMPEGTFTDSAVESEEIAKRDEAITILRDRLQQTMGEVDELRTQLENGGAAPAQAEGSPTEADYRRRDRLRRYKSLLQNQARKIMAAQSALQKRHTDCELVLTNRSRLAELAQQLARAEKKVTANKARSGAAAAILYIFATLTLLAGLSWEVSKRIWPGTFVARAVIDADVGRRVPKPEDLASWQKDHTEMLRDPRLMERAAERMGQRGLPALASAPDLTARLKEDFYVQPSKSGSLTVELRGEGAEKTAMVLDTLVTTFKSYADQAREERSNDIGVVIAQAATAGTEPLYDKRLERAGGLFGGAALAAGLAGLVIWSRLVRAKKKFDHAAAVEAALQEVDWTQLEASIKKHGGKEHAC
jgi:chromosome segregation ATPase